MSRGRWFAVIGDRGFQTRLSSLGHTCSLLGRCRPGHVTTYGEAAFKASRRESTLGSRRDKLRREPPASSVGLGDPILDFAIKQDVYRSITSRCEIQCEDMLLIEDEQHDPSLVHELPKRVFAPLGDRGLTLCDYIFHGDAACDSLEALQELLGLDVSAGDIELDTEHSPVPIASAAIAALGAGISYLLLQD
ncbi:hypothetical protein HPB50_022815 [Hyalomma asiaticum]|uniref:Uncharacterized protein n=1 Tax=Hyalomma asiaticum TaxID=266040 RepID=A0ACB7TMR3_HYAAI|nr:hypothetical protein HPB50_022815 [Hyalomma asiaticum]